ncbi:AAC(3)-I family aminoglycoside N-acetyltransferase [Methylobrevis albus]|uniref:AAC(3)-I family aminoglycoside N-acetyltransferase n=1 Tax=Methylobrevis albus TaxID=2793297 RepID=A0A931I5D1_9HYPH|nr:AAC(3)-I family aminoglycoside N-acetyltransferase [Methylobrevis albus]MBH0239596.1 AAC(3)-I family aminoglycoside N-acetyltransferase [Methylobrevis albus]
MPATRPPPFTIHRFGAGDIRLFRRLLALFGRVFEEPATYGDAQPDDAYLQRLLGGDGFVALGAVADGEVIGGLAAYVLPKFEQARSEIYVYDLAVDAAHRRRGVATALFTALQPIAAEAGAYVIIVQADLPDAPAIALYDKLGRRETVLHFDIAVTPR